MACWTLGRPPLREKGEGVTMACWTLGRPPLREGERGYYGMLDIRHQELRDFGDTIGEWGSMVY